MRCFAAGWDLFTPTRAYAFHLWEKDHRPSYDARLTNAQEATLAESRARVAQLLGQAVTGPPSLLGVPADSAARRAWPRPNGLPPASGGSPAFGMAGVRSLSAYEREAGISFRGLQIEPPARYGYVDEAELRKADDMEGERQRALLELHNSRMLAATPTPIVTAAVLAGTAADATPPPSATAGAGTATGGATATIEALLTPPPDDGKVHVVRDALPAALAREVASCLASLPREIWEVSDTATQPLGSDAKVRRTWRRTHHPCRNSAPRSLLLLLDPRPWRIGKALSSCVCVHRHTGGRDALPAQPAHRPRVAT